jgi:hypothetical protein
LPKLQAHSLFFQRRSRVNRFTSVARWRHYDRALMLNRELFVMLSRDPQINPPSRSSEWNFGLIALLLLGLSAIVALWSMPEIFTQ